MKNNKNKTAGKEARKVLKKQLNDKLLTQIKSVVGEFETDLKKVGKAIEKASRNLAKTLVAKINADSPAGTKTVKVKKQATVTVAKSVAPPAAKAAANKKPAPAAAKKAAPAKPVATKPVVAKAAPAKAAAKPAPAKTAAKPAAPKAAAKPAVKKPAAKA